MILEFAKVLSRVKYEATKVNATRIEWRFSIHKYTHITTDCIGIGPD